MLLRGQIQRLGPRCPFLNESIRFELAPGECLWLQGKSGAGKSSLVMDLLGLRPLPDAQVEVEWPGLDEAQSGFGMVFQRGVLIDSLNVGENIGLALRRAGHASSDEIIVKALEEAGLSAGTPSTP